MWVGIRSERGRGEEGRRVWLLLTSRMWARLSAHRRVCLKTAHRHKLKRGQMESKCPVGLLVKHSRTSIKHHPIGKATKLGNSIPGVKPHYSGETGDRLNRSYLALLHSAWTHSDTCSSSGRTVLEFRIHSLWSTVWQKTINAYIYDVKYYVASNRMTGHSLFHMIISIYKNNFPGRTNDMTFRFVRVATSKSVYVYTFA